MKLYKKILVFLGICLLTYLIYVIILMALSFGHQRMPEADVPEELIELKKEIETDSIKITFYSISQVALEECNAKQEVTLTLSKYSITRSKETIDRYIDSINKAVNERLVDKKCIDSLIIKVSSYYMVKKSNSLQYNHYRYSFPVNKNNK